MLDDGQLTWVALDKKLMEASASSVALLQAGRSWERSGWSKPAESPCRWMSRMLVWVSRAAETHGTNPVDALTTYGCASTIVI